MPRPDDWYVLVHDQDVTLERIREEQRYQYVVNGFVPSRLSLSNLAKAKLNQQVVQLYHFAINGSKASEVVKFDFGYGMTAWEVESDLPEVFCYICFRQSPPGRCDAGVEGTDAAP